jgi:hypothetical protein
MQLCFEQLSVHVVDKELYTGLRENQMKPVFHYQAPMFKVLHILSFAWSCAWINSFALSVACMLPVQCLPCFLSKLDQFPLLTYPECYLLLPRARNNALFLRQWRLLLYHLTSLRAKLG